MRDAAASVGPQAEKRDETHMPLCRAGELAELWKQVGLENVREQSLDAGSLDRDKLPGLRSEVKRRLSVSSENAPFVLRAWAVRGTVPKIA